MGPLDGKVAASNWASPGPRTLSPHSGSNQASKSASLQAGATRCRNDAQQPTLSLGRTQPHAHMMGSFRLVLLSITSSSSHYDTVLGGVLVGKPAVLGKAMECIANT